MKVECVNQKKATSWIGDVSHVIEPLPIDIAHYIADSWFQAVLKRGITKLVIVLPAVDRIKPSAGKIGEVLAQKHGKLLKTFPIVFLTAGKKPENG